MSIFDAPLSLDQEFLACGKRGKITGVTFAAEGLYYRVAFPETPMFFLGEQMFSAKDVSVPQPATSAPNGMEYMLCQLDTCLGVSYYAEQENFIKAADDLLRAKRPYHGYEWDATKGRYVLVQIANHPYPQL
jgi:hypothetical protein